MRDAGQAGVDTKSRPWTIDRSAAAAVADRARAAAGRMIGATADDIAIIPAVSYGVATAARNLKLTAGTRLLIMENEFPSHSLAWQHLAEASDGILDVVPRPDDGD